MRRFSLLLFLVLWAACVRRDDLVRPDEPTYGEPGFTPREDPHADSASSASEEQLRENGADAYLPQAMVRPQVVGAVLPLTGKYQLLGEAVLRGIRLALQDSEIELELVVKDSQGDATLAAKLVEELTLNDGAIAIIGPMLDEDSRRAALVAERLRVPILTLAKTPEITAIGPHVFRNMLTDAQQAQALAQYATKTLGFRSFAVLYPNIPFGVDLAKEFQAQVVARGGAIRVAGSYSPAQTTFTAEARSLVGHFGPERRKRSGRATYPLVDFEALFIPDSWQRVSLVTPALAAEDIITNVCDPDELERIRRASRRKYLRTVTLLGTNTWSSPKGRSDMPELVARGGKFVLCSVYVDGFFVDSERPATQRFVEEFRAEYEDAQPTLLDAIGYDAMGMVRHVIEQDRPVSRAGFRANLAALRDFDGATGDTHFNERREAIKPLFFLTIDAEGIREISPDEGPSGS